MVQSAVTAGQEDVQQIGLQQGEHRLAFGIAEAGIVLHHLGAVGGEHQAKVEHSLEGRPSALRAATVGRKISSIQRRATSGV